LKGALGYLDDCLILLRISDSYFVCVKHTEFVRVPLILISVAEVHIVLRLCFEPKGQKLPKVAPFTAQHLRLAACLHQNGSNKSQFDAFPTNRTGKS
jgi:hypothetical protein